MILRLFNIQDSDYIFENGGGDDTIYVFRNGQIQPLESTDAQYEQVNNYASYVMFHCLQELGANVAFGESGEVFVPSVIDTIITTNLTPDE